DLREERDVARRRLDDVQQALAAAHSLLTGQPLEPTLRAMLAKLAEAAGASHASFLRPDVAGRLRAVAFSALVEDPLRRMPAGIRIISTRLIKETEPRVYQTADNLDLGDALEAHQPPLSAVAGVPVRTPSGLQGLVLLYYPSDSALPGADVLAHLAQM